MYFLLLDDKQQSWERGMRAGKRRWRRKRMLMKTQRCPSSSLQQRVESLQRHIDILQSARKDAVLSARELRRANEKIAAQLNSLTEKLGNRKHVIQVTWGAVVSVGTSFIFLLSFFLSFFCICWDWVCSRSRSFALIILDKCE